MAARVLRDFDGIRVDTQDWPIVMIEFPESRLPDASLAALLRHLEDLMREAEHDHEKVFFITDLTHMHQMTPASQRKLTGEWIQRTALLAKASSAGAAQVTPSAILRGIVTAVYWLHPSPTPSIFVSTRREAFFRAVEMLDAAHVPLTPRLRDLREASRPKR